MISLTPKQLETHGCLLSTVATDALVLKHQTINNHSADKICIVLDQFYTKIYCIHSEQVQTTLENEITLKKDTQSFKGLCKIGIWFVLHCHVKVALV